MEMDDLNPQEKEDTRTFAELLTTNGQFDERWMRINVSKDKAQRSTSEPCIAVQDGKSAYLAQEIIFYNNGMVVGSLRRDPTNPHNAFLFLNKNRADFVVIQ